MLHRSLPSVLVEASQDTRFAPGDVQYFGFFLDKKSKAKLKKALPPAYANKTGNHVTILFSPTEEKIEELSALVGKRKVIQVTNVVDTGEYQAARVRGIGTDRGTPHITISWANGSSPGEGNRALRRDHGEAVQPWLKLNGVFDFYPRTLEEEVSPTATQSTSSLLKKGLKPLEKTPSGRSAGSKGGKATHVPPPAVRAAAKKGLQLRKKREAMGLSRLGGTDIGVARAKQLASGEPIPPRAIRRMKAFFSRHEKNKQSPEWNKPSPGKVAWYLWGGDAGYAWAKKIAGRLEEARYGPGTASPEDRDPNQRKVERLLKKWGFRKSHGLDHSFRRQDGYEVVYFKDQDTWSIYSPHDEIGVNGKGVKRLERALKSRMEWGLIEAVEDLKKLSDKELEDLLKLSDEELAAEKLNAADIEAELDARAGGGEQAAPPPASDAPPADPAPAAQDPVANEPEDDPAPEKNDPVVLQVKVVERGPDGEGAGSVVKTFEFSGTTKEGAIEELKVAARRNKLIRSAMNEVPYKGRNFFLKQNFLDQDPDAPEGPVESAYCNHVPEPDNFWQAVALQMESRHNLVEAEIDTAEAKIQLEIIRDRLDDLLNLFELDLPASGSGDDVPEYDQDPVERAFKKLFGKRRGMSASDKKHQHKNVKSAHRYFHRRFKLGDGEKIRNVSSRQRKRFDLATGILEAIGGGFHVPGVRWTQDLVQAGYGLRLALRVPRYPPEL